MRRLILTMIVLGTIGLAYVLGFITSDQDLIPSHHITSLKIAVKKILPIDDATTATSTRRLETSSLNLQLAKVKVPFDDPGAGGGLTSVADELVLINRFGEIFLIEDQIPSLLNISTPVNHLNEYLEFSTSPNGATFTHDPDSIRFNDILHVPGTKNSLLVISYTNWHPAEQCYNTTVAKLTLPENLSSLRELSVGPEDWAIVFRTQPCLPLKSMMRAIEGHMAGGRLAVAGEQSVFLSSGDYHWDGVYAPEALAQSSDNDYGKVLNVNLESGHADQVSVGVRNPQGIAVDRRGRIWTTEHGPRGGDELNLVEAGGNYGWPEATLGTRYNRLPWPDAEHGRHSNFQGPVHAWLPSIGVSNLIEIQGFDPSWDGDLLVASLRQQSLFRLRIVEAQVRFAEQIVIGERIRYVHQHTNGDLVLWTDSEHLVFLSKDDTTPTVEYIEAAIASMDLTSEHHARLAAAITYCSECHSFDNLGSDGAPTLAGIHGRPVASTDYPYYSRALLAYSGKWTTPRLRAYLHEPSETVPGTTMPSPNLAENTIDNLLVLLEALSQPE